MLTFATFCKNETWELLQTQHFLKEQIERNSYGFATRLLFIHQMHDTAAVQRRARELVSQGVLTAYYQVEDHDRAALASFGLSRSALGDDYEEAIGPLVSLWLCATPYLLHFTGNAWLENLYPWVDNALKELERNHHAAVANPTWNGCFAEAAREAHAADDHFFIGQGFSDQCYLMRTAEVRTALTGSVDSTIECRPSKRRWFQARVDAWMRRHHRVRLTHRQASYRSPVSINLVETVISTRGSSPEIGEVSSRGISTNHAGRSSDALTRAEASISPASLAPQRSERLLVLLAPDAPIDHRPSISQQAEYAIVNADGQITGLTANATFDTIFLQDLLTCVCDPTALLRQARRWLATNGRIVARVPNLRHREVVSALLRGSWAPPDSGTQQLPLHYFTRREIEKVFYRAGYTISALRPHADEGYTEWQRLGRPRRVQAGPLWIEGLSARDTEEFHIRFYQIEGKPELTPEWGLTSIVILTHNQLPFTRMCLDSIHLHTDEPYELIVVDNASTDGSPEYLRAVPGIRLILNDVNRGFPAAVNQGLQVATGNQILLLNNDTVVTTGWLRRLLEALYSAENVGLVGPCSNYVSGEQQVAVDYDDDLTGLDGFAWDWGQEHTGQRISTNRLVGFCLLFRRQVMNQVGLLDERFGLGCFEDDDYCLRALQAGYHALIARDAFVHHVGGLTFRAEGINFARLMHQNEQLFREKWSAIPFAGGQESKRAETPAPKPGGLMSSVKSSPRIDQTLQLSLCMIVRDNASIIEPCLESIRPWVDEIVVVDTGSKDETPRIAERLGARLFHFPWCDSFAAARNESLRHARGRWIFWMDSDDTIDAVNGHKLQKLIEQEPGHPIFGFVMQVHCTGAGQEGQLNVTVVDHVKLFHNLPELRFEGRIHEQILPAIRRAGGDIAWTDIFVTHSGYDHSPEGQERKKQRDLHLLELELHDQPEHPFTLFNLGMTYADIGEYEKAVDFLALSLKHSAENASHVRKIFALQVYCLSKLGRRAEATVACDQGLQRFPEDIELRFRRGILLHEMGRLREALEMYQDILRHPGERYFTSVDRGIQGFKARQNLAVVYSDLGEWTKAEEQWRRVTEEVPAYRAGWRGLAESLLRQNKQQEVLELTQRLTQDDHLAREGVYLAARLAVARGEVNEARQLLQWCVKEYPEDQEPWQELCRLLFEQADATSAAAALEELTRRRPDDAAAHHNLAMTYQRLSRYQDAVVAYRRSLQQRPDAVETWFQLGDALYELGEIDEAATAWKEVLRRVPEHARAREALQRSEAIKSRLC